MTPSLIVAGHAPLDPIVRGRGTADAAGIVETMVDHVRVMRVPRDPGPDAWENVALAARGATAAILWDGEAHMRTFLAAPSPPIDFVLAAAPALPLDPAASYVAELQLRALFAPDFAPLGPLVARLREETGRPVLIAGTPPPLGPEAMEARVAQDSRVASLAARLGVEPRYMPLTSAYTLQKLWSLTQGMLAETALAHGGRFVPVPDRLRGDDGFLRPELAGDDIDSAGLDYALDMLAELDRAATEDFAR